MNTPDTAEITAEKLAIRIPVKAILAILFSLLSAAGIQKFGPSAAPIQSVQDVLLDAAQAASAPPAAAVQAAQQQASEKNAAATAKKDARTRIMDVARSQIGTRERTGNNDGPVDKYLVAVGLGGTRNPYCAAFVRWCGVEALGKGCPYPRSAWSPDMVAKPTWKNGKGTAPRAGDTFGIWFASKGRIAHTGLVESVRGSMLVTVEANTSPDAGTGTAADREGGGVWRRYRPLATIHSVRSWLP